MTATEGSARLALKSKAGVGPSRGRTQFEQTGTSDHRPQVADEPSDQETAIEVAPSCCTFPGSLGLCLPVRMADGGASWAAAGSVSERGLLPGICDVCRRVLAERLTARASGNCGGAVRHTAATMARITVGLRSLLRAGSVALQQHEVTK